MSICRSNAARDRWQKERPTWDALNENISDTHFRRIFRMSRDCFNHLHSAIIRNVELKNFKSEAYIN